jgi:hypothetical protein
MLKISSILALILGSLLLLTVAPARAQVSDRALLSTFCDPALIKGTTCEQAKFYPNGESSACDVKLSDERSGGRFIASGNPLMVISYQSSCERGFLGYGGAVVFEEIAGKYLFRGFQPGKAVNGCVTTARDARQDLLVCLTGQFGQGALSTGVAQILLTRDFDGSVSMALDFLLTGEDDIGAFGANVVTCKQGPKTFGVSKLRAGAQPRTVSAEISFADTETIRTACGKGFPKPKETFGKLSPGEAYVPEGFEKHGRRTIDLVTRQIVPE